MNFHTAPRLYTGEVFLNVSDLGRSVHFYKEMIGFKTLKEEAGRVVLTADGKTPLLVLEQPENVKPKEARRSGLYHFALLLPTRSDLGNIIKHFAANNIKLGAADHLVSEALYLSDPDGNGIEIYTDRNPEEWEWVNGKVAMSSDPLNAESIVAESAGQQWEGLPEGTIMGHIHLHVANLADAEAFYNALGFEVVSHYPQAIFMSEGKYHHHIGLNTWNGEGAMRPSAGSVGLRAYTLVYPDEEALRTAVSKVKEFEVEPATSDNAYIVEDPSGNRIILRVEESNSVT